MINVVLVDDQDGARRGIQMLLSLESDMTVVGEANDGVTAVSLVQDLDPDVVLMDVGMPGVDGIAATLMIREAAPRSAVVIHTMHDDAGTRARAESAGAAGFVSKCDCADGQLVTAIRQAAHRN